MIIFSSERDSSVLKQRLNKFDNGDYIEFNTSGTTGDKKLVIHSASSMRENANSFNEHVGIDSTIRMYHCLPFDYMGGFLNTVLSPILCGGTSCIGSMFSPFAFWEEINRLECNAVWLSPTMIAALSRSWRGTDQEAKRVASGLRFVFSGFSGLPRVVQEMWEDQFGKQILSSYGTSEAMLVSCQTRHGVCGVGHPLPGTSVRIAADLEIEVHSGNASPTYIDADGNASGVPMSDEYMLTGDLGGVHGDGELFIVGRKKDVIKKGGRSISPSYIEGIVRGVPGVLEVAVIGKPHHFWGETISLFVKTDGTSVYDECMKAIPLALKPDEFVVLDDMPMTDSGKVAKSELRNKITKSVM